MHSWVFDPEGRPRLGWRVAICLVAFLFLQLLVAIAAFFFFSAAVPGSAPQDGPAGKSLRALAIVPGLLGTLLAVWGCRRFLDRRSFVSLGLGAPAFGWGGTLGIGLGAPLLLLGGLIGALIGLRTYVVTGVTTSGETWLFFALLLPAAFSEELLMRGYVLENLMEASGAWAAVAVSSVLFWLLHAFNPSVWSSPLVPVNLFGAGVVLALVYLASGDLWLPTVLHYGWNVTEGLVFQLPVSGVTFDGIVDLEPAAGAPEWLNGGSFGFEGSILATLAEVVLGLVFYRLWQRRRALAGPRIPEVASQGR